MLIPPQLAADSSSTARGSGVSQQPLEDHLSVSAFHSVGSGFMKKVATKGWGDGSTVKGIKANL